MGTVTVVIPTRDRAALLNLTLTSVLRQRNVELSVTVVDDGSIEDVGTVVAGTGDVRVRCVRHETPQGVSTCRNRGWMEATTEWVAFCDDDDVWSPDKAAPPGGGSRGIPSRLGVRGLRLCEPRATSADGRTAARARRDGRRSPAVTMRCLREPRTL